MTKENDETSEQEKTKSRRPRDGPFQQQKLPAWQPVMIPKTVLPTLFIIGIIFCPAGGLLWWSSNRVSKKRMNKNECLLPFYLSCSIQIQSYHYSNESTFLNPNWGNPNQLTVPRCTLDFTVPTTMKGPVYMYYRLTNFYQNHRQYIKNFDSSQLLGEVVSSTTLHTDCDPLAYSNGKVIYPCGLIANSMFNDTVSNFTSIDHPSLIYSFSSNNIAWPSDKKKYGPTKYPLSDIVPPPNWANRYPNGQYTAEYPPPNLSQDEHFMVWMHVAALPDFRKIWGRNDSSDLPAGRWRVTIDMNFDTLQYSGTKWLVLSTTTPLGGRNPYLGIAYMAIGAICILLGIVFSLRQLIKPRKLGDESYLSWNQPGGGLPKNKRANELEHLHKE
ncbi:Lem3/Cdc50 [Rhizopus microsporus ATCC 52813]|uniref:Lem3/Cdc50 n=1 Tax=Rhizopus microsporus ATCC 52813 TaxID=1340429 RepID=A0A2G4SJL7_RHIZD|nr:Lem3/Cdc50 [Rhizopus microsporus ATCC 52813]PHZ08970.1 Lem3/Cdc50 [Rhizopus microsporus ATCC 52813]